MASMIKAGQHSGVGACENNDCGMRIEETTKSECVMKKDWCTMHEVFGRKMTRTKQNGLYGYEYKKKTYYKCMSGGFEDKRTSTMTITLSQK